MFEIMPSLESLIGYTFSNAKLLEEAVTHASLAKKLKHEVPSNQRLEFLGDAVLQLTLSEVLFRLWPNADEGTLSKGRSRLVSTLALANMARRMGLGRFLKMDRGEESNGGRDRDSILADAFEAITGAVYLDGGIGAGQELVKRLFEPDLAELQAQPEDQNPKGRLQEKLQSLNREAPTYHVLESSGPDHDRSFVVEVRWNGRVLGRGVGRSKKEAEAAAAGVAWAAETGCG